MLGGRMVAGIGHEVLDQAAGDLADFERVRQPRAIEVAVAEIEDLGLALQPAERGGVNDARIVDVERIAGIGVTRCAAFAAAFGPRRGGGWNHDATIKTLTVCRRR